MADDIEANLEAALRRFQSKARRFTELDRDFNRITEELERTAWWRVFKRAELLSRLHQVNREGGQSLEEMTEAHVELAKLEKEVRQIFEGFRQAGKPCA